MTSAPPVPLRTRVTLSALMFGQNFVTGSYVVTLGTYLATELDASGQQISLAVMCQALGAIASPFIVGLIADRYVAAEKILRVLHLTLASALLLAGRQTTFLGFFICALIAMGALMPTVSLANAVAFRHLTDPSRQFAPIRVFGTLGWVVAGLTIGWLALEQNGQLGRTFTLAASAALVLVILTFFLPHTPPEAARARTPSQVLGLDAVLPLFRNRSYLVFFISATLLGIPMAFYYTFTNLFLNEIGVHRAAAVQTIGQMAEMAILLLLPLALRRFGFRVTIALGMSAWILRYVLFTAGNSGSLYGLILLGLLMHGFCFNFVFVTGQIYTDSVAPPGVRSAAQGLTALGTSGVGALIGTLAAGRTVDAFVTSDGHDWVRVWPMAGAMVAVILVVFLAFFRDQPKDAQIQPD